MGRRLEKGNLSGGREKGGRASGGGRSLPLSRPIMMTRPELPATWSTSGQVADPSFSRKTSRIAGVLNMKTRAFSSVLGPVVLLAVACLTVRLVGDEYKSGIEWPEPKIITPGVNGGPPSDAIVLFDGKSLAPWENASQWIIKDGVATVQGGSITTKQGFGSCQLHLEFATPAVVSGEGQGRGNSGVYFQGLYEVQILDSYENTTYYDGQAASIYKQWPPLVNCCRKPGEWQTYDIIFDAPKFSDQGKLVKPAYFTVLHNGVLVQNHAEVLGATSWDSAPKYAAHAEKLPISLQDHGNPMRFRNIWIREL